MAFETEIERIGKITAADQKLEVRLQGTLAYSLPGLVNLPTPEVYKHLGRYAKRMIHGLLDHEVAHERYTDHRLMGAAKGLEEDLVYAARKYGKLPMKQIRELQGEVLGGTFNAAEDGRIEVRHGADYPGAAQNMHRKNRWFLEDPDPRVPAPKQLWDRFLLAFTVVARKSAAIEEYAPGAPFEDEEVHGMLTASKRLLAELSLAQDSADALIVAVKLMRLFDEESRKQDEEKESGGGMLGEGDGSEEQASQEPGEPGDEEEGSESTPSKGSPEEGAEGDDEAASGGDEGDDETETGKGTSEGEDEASEGGEGEGSHDRALAGEYEMDLRGHKPGGRPLTPEDAVNFIIKQIFQEPDNKQPYLVFNRDYDIERDFSEGDLREESEEWAQIKDEARIAAEALGEAFEVALRARREKHPVPGFDEGTVDIGMMGEYALGAVTTDEIFQQEVSIDDRDCAVAVMIDCSGSMSSVEHPNSKSRLARLTAAAMHEALSRCQIAHEITGFTCIDSANVRRHEWCRGIEGEVAKKFAALRAGLQEEERRGVDTYRYARERYGANLLVPFHAIFKSFATLDARALTRLTGIHENLDGESVLWQARRLATRPEPRRIMFVLSDGLPHGSRNTAQGARYLKETIERVTASGIEVYGIGIKSAHVKNFYPRSWVARNLNELCDVALSGMIEILTEARQEHAWVQQLSA